MDDLFFHPGDQVPPVIGPKEPDPPLLSPPKKAFPSSAKKGFFLGISLLLLLAAGVLGVTAVQKGGIFNIFKRATQDEDDPSCSINLQQPTFRPGEESTFSVTFNSPDEPIRWPCSGGTTFGDCNCDSFAVLCFSHSSTKGTTQEVSNNCSGDIHDCTVNFKFTASDSLGSGQINIAVKNTDGSGSCSHLIDIVAPTVTPTSVIPTLTPTPTVKLGCDVSCGGACAVRKSDGTCDLNWGNSAYPLLKCCNLGCDCSRPAGDQCQYIHGLKKYSCGDDECASICSSGPTVTPIVTPPPGATNTPTSTPAMEVCLNLIADRKDLSNLKIGDTVNFTVTVNPLLTITQVALRVRVNSVDEKIDCIRKLQTENWTCEYPITKAGSYEIAAFVKLQDEIKIINF